MAKEQAASEGGGAATEDMSILDRIISEGNMAQDDAQAEHAKNLVGEFANQILSEEITVSSDSAAMINERIARIDELLSDQLNEIMHSQDFQELEGSWRGLSHLISNSETGARLKIRVLAASQKEVQDDLDKAVEFDQSRLFKLLYEEEYGTFGGNPYSCILADFEFGRHPQDIALLEKLSNVAAAAHAPMIAAASPKMFDLQSYTRLGAPRDLAKVFESSELIKWNSFRATEDSRYVSLVLPHILMRLPYGPDTKPVDGFNFVEEVDGRDHQKYLWGNAAWALGERITNAFSLYGWTAAIRGVEGGGMVEGLPAHTFKTDEGDVAMKCPTEIAITDRREKELNDLGFISLCHCQGTDYAAFFGGASAQKPMVYNTPQANANARISAQLPYVMAASRFAHYLKVIMRDKVGSFMTRGNVETFLNRWISDYVLINDDAPQSAKASYPLSEGRVDVVEIAGKPGSYAATVYLKPHFQLEELTASMRLVAELPPPAGG
ncbi:MAG: type VI secretion system contractile sheath large subunit [Longimicrobiales bacterium]